MSEHYHAFTEHLAKINDLNKAASVLHWDQEVNMPKKGAQQRARQLATLSGIAHELSTDPKLGTLLEELIKDDSLDTRQKANVREAKLQYDKQKKYDNNFVRELSKVTSEALEAWQKARNENNFEVFAPILEKVVDLKRKEAEILGYDEHPYDALINQFEPGTTTKDIDQLFADVKAELVDFVRAIAAQPQNSDEFLFQEFNHDEQFTYSLDILKQMGYDFDCGRQDISTHPFTTNFGSEDVRVTTRINEKDIREMIWTTLHEGGHALYELGLNPDDYGLASGEYLSLGIHESQSRLWENNVGRERSYWEANYESLQQAFPVQLGHISLDRFYAGINLVKPSLIRTGADEVTYHFHVMIRFEIEKALLEGSLEVRDLRNVWNNKYNEYLGIDVPDDINGVLQDVHWAHGGFGYFPTYSIGSFYAAQFYNTAQQQIPQLEQQLAQGDCSQLLTWLRENIHQHGRVYSPAELCTRVTGEPLNFAHFMNYARKKFSALYQLEPSAV